MKYIQLRAFEKHLEASAPHHFAPIYLILSKESALRKMAADRLLHFLQQGSAPSSLSLKILEGERVHPQELYTELNSLSFFSEKQIVLIHQADQLKNGSKEVLEEELGKPKRALFIVLTAETLLATTNFYKKIEKTGVVLDLNQPEKPWEKEKRMQEWMASQAASCGKTLDPAASQALLQQLGTDFALLQQELEKLICYVGDRPKIQAQDVAAICLSVPLETVWQLGEAIFQRHTADAIRIGSALLSEAGTLFMLLRQIRSQFQTELQVCSILSNGGTAADVSAAFPYMKGPILARHMQLSQGYGLPSLKKGLLEIDRVETTAKNSSTDPEILAELLWIKLTSKEGLK